MQKRAAGDNRLAELCRLLRHPGPIGIDVIAFLQGRVLTQTKVVQILVGGGLLFLLQ